MAENGPINRDPYRFRIGSYGILHPLGSGGMSSVYRAAHLETGHEVALKVLPLGMARNATILKRFVAEARSAESLEHPNIVQIFDRGSDDGRYYLVLEYIGGGDLHEYVQHRGPLPPQEAVGLITQAARGLEYALTKGVIHRDVKPSNLLLTPLGEVKIADLGLALRAEEEDERVTREGTTVGTVDYMSPEQARDSRATSFQSDIYSLGCTLYYLLTGLPPFPGGDITEKLTKHARTPPPDVRERRPDLPESVAALVRRMLAKRPEERYSSYRELIAALRTSVDGDESSIALVPLDDEPRTSPPREQPAPALAAAAPSAALPRPNSSMPEISLSSLAPGLLGEASDMVDSPALAPFVPGSPAVPLPRNPIASGNLSLRTDAVPEDVWIFRCVLIGALVIAVVIGLDLILRPFPDFSHGSLPEPARPARTRAAGDVPPSRPAAHAGATAAPRPAQPRPPLQWEEPTDPVVPVRPSKTYSPAILAVYLPDWARTPAPSEIPGRLTVVRRGDGGKGTGTVATLRQAFDAPDGTIELADVGPFRIEDLRIGGGTRLIRSRPGYRSIVRIESPRIDAVRAMPGVFTLDGRNLILDSLDIVLNVRDLGANQRALFHGSGCNLTLRNCTITIFNPNRSPFAVVRCDDAGSRVSRVRIEDSLIRGDVFPMFELGRGETQVVALRSFLISEGPIIRTSDPTSRPEHRFFALGSAMGCRGPMIDLNAGPRADSSACRLIVHAYDTIFGRLSGQGVASLVSSDLHPAQLNRILSWHGLDNMYSGWASYFSTGTEHTIRVRSLAAFRSTWNSEASSRESPDEWPGVRWVADLAPSTISPYLPGWEDLVEHVARPRPGLKSRTVFGFSTPPVPSIMDPPPAAPSGAVELTFDADAASTWEGDLGAFLRDHRGRPGGRLVVRVVGSGNRKFSPVRLADGSTVEIRVEGPASGAAPGRSASAAEWDAGNAAGGEKHPLVFMPAPDSAGDALISLTGGILSLSDVRFRVEGAAGVESLIRVDDGSLALNRCELTAPTASDRPPPRLVWFRAATTRPHPAPPAPPISGLGDGPTCVLSECVLATAGDALRAEVGRGHVALSRCAVAARGDVFTLVPAQVARARFLADLTIDHCTVATSRAAVRVAAWPGTAPGPDRPWLVSSSNTAYLDISEGDPRTSVLCRADPDALAQGQVSWSQRNDAIELHAFAALGDAPLPARARDVATQWVDLWSSDHIRDVTGPHPGAATPSVRLIGRPRSGRIEPADLALDPRHHVGRPSLTVGPGPGLLRPMPTSKAGTTSLQDAPKASVARSG